MDIQKLYHGYSVADFCGRAAKAWSEETALTNEKVTLKLMCYNKTEADEVKACMGKYFPDVPFITTWLEFNEPPLESSV